VLAFFLLDSSNKSKIGTIDTVIDVFLRLQCASKLFGVTPSPRAGLDHINLSS